MTRTKGSKNKQTNTKINNKESTEPKIKKPRGIQPGQKIEREPAVYVEINKDYRIKMDKWNWMLQEKCKAKEEVEDSEDAGFKNLGYYSPRIEGLVYIISKMISVQSLKKSRKEKEEVIQLETFVDTLVKTAEKIIKMFPPFEEIIMKKKGLS